MPYLIGLVLVAICLYVVMLPFLRRRNFAGVPSEPTEALRVERHHLYEQMRALALEHELGHISREEYVSQLQEYRVRAAELLRQEDLLSREMAALDKQAEKRIQSYRRTPKGQRSRS
jgi:hypothetical protein